MRSYKFLKKNQFFIKLQICTHLNRPEILRTNVDPQYYLATYHFSYLQLTWYWIHTTIPPQKKTIFDIRCVTETERNNESKTFQVFVCVKMIAKKAQKIWFIWKIYISFIPFIYQDQNMNVFVFMKGFTRCFSFCRLIFCDNLFCWEKVILMMKARAIDLN